MKFPIFQMGQVGLLLTCTVLITSCNKQDEFFQMEEFVAGVDAYCSQAEDVNSCLALGSFCQPAYEASEFEMAEPVFAACVANRGALPPVDSGTVVDDGSSAGTGDGTVVDDGSSTGTGDGTVVDDGSSTGTGDGTVVDDGSSTGSDGTSTDGSGTVVDDGSSSTDDDSSSDVVTVVEPTIDETIAANCANLPEEYLWIKKQVKVKKGYVASAIKGGKGNGQGNGNSNGNSGGVSGGSCDISGMTNPNKEWKNPLENLRPTISAKKVKVCHHTANGSAHTIIIACQALKAHVDHHEDYLGVCK